MFHRRRDSQRQRAYASERAAGHFHPRYRLPSFAATEALTWEIAAKYGADDLQEVVYNSRRGGAQAVGRWRIEYGPEGLNVRTILHEVAHLLAPGDRHGRTWARVYLDMVRRELGAEEARRLKAEFVKRKVKHTRERRLSLAARERLAERGRQLAAARQRSLTSASNVQEG
jgi:hypothetical protein